jgi:NTE family protein
VSGGSIANGLFAGRYEELAADEFSGAGVDRLLVAPLIAKITSASLQRSLIKGIWRLPGRTTRTDLLAEALDEWFFDGRVLEELSPTCRFIFNGANLSTGVRFGFERDVLGDYVVGLVPTAGSGFPLATAVACSAAFPGAFSPFEVGGFDFPCANGRVPKVLDGGAYDNMGLEPVDDLPQACLVALNAGGTFQVSGRFGRVPIVRDLMRVNALLYRQSTGLRRADMVERFQAWERARTEGVPPPRWARRGVLFSLATVFAATDEWLGGRPEREELRIPLALVETSLDRFSREVCEQLVYRGWWLAGATLSRYHRELLPAELPAWRPLAA